MERRRDPRQVPLPSDESTPAGDGRVGRRDPGRGLAPGERVGRYIVVCPIGSGGMGDVYLARDPALDRDVALKMIRSDLLGAKRVRAFLREAKTTARFSHPNIVVIHEVGTHEGQPFLALEYLDGPSLREWLADAAPSMEEVLRIGYDVAEALVAAHERDIVHRDLKPGNVVVAKDGRAHVVDFGLAAALDEQRTRAGGTPKYMAPEQRRGEEPTPAVDMWAIGLILKELLARFAEATETSSDTGPATGSKDDFDRSLAPPSLTMLLDAACQEDPRLRPNAAVFRDAIARQLEELRVEQELAQTRQLLGRDAERKTLLDEAIALRDGSRGSIIGIEGEAGLGKTLLLLDFVHQAQINGLQVVSGAVDVIHRHSPFGAWREALRELLGSGGDSSGPTGDSLRFALPGGLHPFVPILETVMRTSEVGPDGAAPVELETRAEVTIRVLTEVVSHIARKPVVVVIDDWQWADSASWRLARSVALHIPNLLLVLCYRPVDPASPEKVALEQLPRFKSITLPPLTDGAVRGIVQNRAPGTEPTGELTRLVVQHAAGNPLFAEELTALAQHSGTGDLSSGTTLQSVLQRRLETLPRDVLDVMLTASVVGRRFDQNLLRRLHEPKVVRTALDRLLDLGLIRRLEGRYAFWHELTRSVTYERLSDDERRERHRAVAGSMEEEGGEATRQYGALANHWYEAGDLERAVHYSDLAAEQALTTGAYQEALRFLRRCLRVPSHADSGNRPPARPIKWRRQLAGTHYALGQLKEAREEALRVLALAGREFPSSRLGYRVGTARLFLQALRLTREKPGGETRAASQEPWQLDIARALGTIAIASWFFNEDDPTHYAALAAFCEAHRFGPSRALVRASSRLGCELGLRGWTRAASRFEQLAREVAEELDDAPATAYSCMTDALFRVGVGDWDRMRGEIDQCQRICEEFRDDTNWCNAQAIRYWGYHYRGMSEEARQAAQDLSDRAERTGNDQHRGWGARDMALEMLDAGDPEAAQRTLEDALGLLARAGRRIELIPARGALSVAWLRLGEQDRAVEEVDETLRLLSHSKGLTSHATLEGCSGVAEVLLTAQGEAWPHKTAAGWHRAVDQALKTLKTYSSTFPIGLPRYYLWKGVASQYRDRETEAQRWWKKGLTAAVPLSLGRDIRLLSERLAG